MGRVKVDIKSVRAMEVGSSRRGCVLPGIPAKHIQFTVQAWEQGNMGIAADSGASSVRAMLGIQPMSLAFDHLFTLEQRCLLNVGRRCLADIWRGTGGLTDPRFESQLRALTSLPRGP
jgi:hypothetical protein